MMQGLAGVGFPQPSFMGLGSHMTHPMPGPAYLTGHLPVLHSGYPSVQALSIAEKLAGII